MKHRLLYVICPIIFLSVFLFLMCGEIPINPADDPNNVRATVIVMNNTGTGIIYQNQAIQLGIIIRYPDMIRKVRVMYSDNLSGDTLYSNFLPGEAFDTVITTHTFATTGKKTINVDVDLTNGTVKQFSYDLEIVARQLTVSFDTLPQLTDTITTGIPDTMFFVASTDPIGGAVVFTAESNPSLDTTALRISSIGQKACVIVTTSLSGNYDITVTAKSGTASKRAIVKLISESRINLREASSIAAMTAGTSDTLLFLVNKSVTDTINNVILLNEALFKPGELVPVIKGTDTTCFTFTPSETKVYNFLFEITVNNKKDTLSYNISVTKETSMLLKQDTATVNTKEGELINLPLAPYLADTAVELSVNKGNVNNKSIIYSVPSGIILDTVVITVSRNSVMSILKIYLNVSPIDTSKPVILLVNPTKDSSKISSSSLNFEISCTDASGISAVTCHMGTIAMPVAKGTSNSFIASISGLAAGPNVLTFTATDSSSNANVSIKIFTIIYDPSMEDNVPPAVRLKNPTVNESAVFKDSVTASIVCADDNGIATVTCLHAGTAVPVVKSSDSLYSSLVTGLKYGLDTITFTVTDNSVNANPKVFPVIVKYTKFTVTYNENNLNVTGEAPVDTATYEAGDSASVSAPGTLALKGFTFSGWDTVANGSGKFQAADKLKIVDKNLTLFAQWKINNVAPVIKTQPVSISVNKGASATFSFTLNSDDVYPVPTIKWVKNDVDTIPNSNALSYTISSATTADDGNEYHAVVSNSAGSVKSEKATLAINPIPPVLGTLSSVSVNKGATATFIISLNSDVYPAPTIKWFKNNTEISSGTSLSYTTPATTYEDDQSKYKVVVSSGINTETSNTAVLTVLDATIPEITLSGDNPMVMVLGSTFSEPGYSASDDNDGNITASITVSGAPNSSTPVGRYTVTYKVSDQAGNKAANKTRIVCVEGWEQIISFNSGSNGFSTVLGHDSILYIYHDSKIDRLEGGTLITLPTPPYTSGTIRMSRNSTKLYFLDHKWPYSGKLYYLNNDSWTEISTALNWDANVPTFATGPNDNILALNEKSIKKYSPSEWTSLGTLDDYGYTLRHNSSYNDRLLTITDNDIPYVVGLNGNSITCVKYNNGNWIPADGSNNSLIASLNYDLSSVQIAETGNEVYVGFTDSSAYSTERYPYIYQLNGSNWTSLNSLSSNEDVGTGFCINSSSDNLLYAVCNSKDANGGYSNIIVRKWLPTINQWDCVPSKGDKTAFKFENCTNLSIEAGLNVCYVVCQQGIDKISVWKYHKQ